MRNVTIGFLVLFSVAARAQNSFLDHYEKAQALIQNAQYQAAVDELDAAYQLRALAAADAPPPPPVAFDPRLSLGAPQLAVRYELRSDRAMIAGGAALFASSYLAATIAGSIFVGAGGQGGDNCGGYSYSGPMGGTNCFSYRDAGGVLFIPLLGPFISAGGAANPT